MIRESWFGKTRRTYIGNASSVRDFRAQLRGNKAIWLWSSYLAVLVLIVGLSYSSLVSDSNMPISMLQTSLRGFYATVIGWLGFAIMLISPALTASTIGIERQRRSLDLVFSAPVEPKYLLVGKLISSYRYIWMLLMLSLPATAVSVLMGGATWVDVIGAYVILSSAGLVYASIGLLMSAIANSPAAAVLYSFIAVGIYSGLTTMFGGITFLGMGMRSNLEAPWVTTLNPFTAALTAPTHTVLFGTEVPNWVFAVLFSLFMSKVLVLGAGSALSPFGSRETKSLRIHALLTVLLFSCGLVYGLNNTGALAMMGGAPFSTTVRFVSMIPAAIIVSCTLFLVPMVACFSNGEGQRTENDGEFSWKGMWLGTPAGALPFLLLLAASIFAGALASALIIKTPPSDTALAIFLWSCGLMVMWWGIARLISSVTSSVKVARQLYLGILLALVAMPIPVLTIVTANLDNPGRDSSGAWRFHLFFPIGSESRADGALPYAAGMMLVGFGTAVWARRNAGRPLRRREI